MPNLLTDFAAAQAQIAAARAILDNLDPAMANISSEIAQLFAGQIPVVPPAALPTITGTTYYVSAAGDDSAAGTASFPWKTITKVNSVTFRPGDAVLFRGGDLFSGTLTSAASGVTFASYGTGNAILYSAQGYGISLTNISALWIGNLTILGVGGQTNKGIYLTNDGTPGMLVGPQIRNVTITGFGSDGILLSGHPGSGFTAPLIDSCISYGNTFGDTGALTSGIGLWGGGASNSNPMFTNPTISNCKVYSNPGCSGPNWSGSGIFIQGSHAGVVQNNEVYSNGASSHATNGSGPVGIWTADSDGLLIQFNESYLNSSLGADGGGFDLDGGVINCICQFNYAHDNRNYGINCYAYEGNWGNNTIRYNILTNNSGSQFTYGGTGGAATLGELDVYNNIMIGGSTYVDQSWHAVITCPDWLPQQFSKVVIANNLLDATLGGWLAIINSSTSTTTFEKNCYVGSPGYVKWAGTGYTGVNTWQSGTGQDPAGIITSDPLLVSRYDHPTTHGYAPASLPGLRCEPTSPLLGAGADLHALFGFTLPSTDYFGTTIPPINIGAGD